MDPESPASLLSPPTPPPREPPAPPPKGQMGVSGRGAHHGSGPPTPAHHASPRLSQDSAFDDVIAIEDDEAALLERGFRGYSAAADPEGADFVPPKVRRDLIRTFVLAGITFAVVAVVVYFSLPSSQTASVNPILLISLDGFRPSYLSPENTPNLLELAASGAIADYMLPVFPSVTFASHSSIATGLLPEAHGIVNNMFRAPDVRNGDQSGWFDHGPGNDSRYWLGEPIWTTVEFNNLPSAAIMFPGSESPHGPLNTLPSHLVPFDMTWTTEQKVAKTLEFLALEPGRSGRPILTALYVNDVDTTGHFHGPNSKEINETVKQLDAQLGMLFKRARELIPTLTIVVVSDHGMAEIKNNMTIALDQYLDLDKVTVISHQPIAFIEPLNPSETPDIYARLKNGSLSGKGAGKWRVWLREEMPAEWDYSHSPRIAPIVALPEDGWTFVLKSSGEGRGKWIRGTHGFDPEHPDMHAIFMMNGPPVAAGTKLRGGFRNTEIYSLLCRLLWGRGWEGWKVAPTNWTAGGRAMISDGLLGGW